MGEPVRGGGAAAGRYRLSRGVSSDHPSQRRTFRFPPSTFAVCGLSAFPAFGLCHFVWPLTRVRSAERERCRAVCVRSRCVRLRAAARLDQFATVEFHVQYTAVRGTVYRVQRFAVSLSLTVSLTCDAHGHTLQYQEQCSSHDYDEG